MDRIYHNGNSDITLNQIYTFIVVAEYGNFTRASAELHISQPSISKTISKLEEATGMNIFIRNPRGALLTNAGKVLYKEWKEALNALQMGYEKSCSVIADNRSLKIAVPVNLSPDSRIFSIIEELALSHDEISFDLDDVSYSDLRRGLAAEKYDVIFTPSFDRQHFDEEGFTSKKVDEDLIYFVSSKKNPVRNPEQGLDVLFTLAGQEYEHYNSFVSDYLSNEQIKVKQIKELDTIEDIWISCIRGKGCFLYNKAWFPKFKTDSLICTPTEQSGGTLMIWSKSSTNSQIKLLKKYV